MPPADSYSTDGLVQFDQCPESCQGSRDPPEHPPLWRNHRWILTATANRIIANDEAEANAPPKVLRRVSFKGTATEIPTKHVATTKVNVLLSVGSPKSGKLTSVPSVVRSLGDIYQPGWDVTNDCRLDTPDACQDTVDHIAPLRYSFELCHLLNADFLSQYNINLARQVAIGSQLRLRFEQEVRLLKKARAKIARRDQRIRVRKEEIKKLDQEVKSLRAIETKVHGLCNQTKNLGTLLEAEADMKKVAEAKNAELTKELESLHITGEEKIKAASEEFKKYEDARVEQRCAKMDARLDALSIDFNKELYPHMLTAIVFANVVSTRIAKEMSEGLKYGIEHGKAGRDLVDVEAYDPEANDKLVKALQNLKDLNYPMVDQLERLKDAPMELIMASLHLEGDTEEDAPQRIHDLRPSSSKLKIPMYPEVHNPKYPWAVKEEMLLEDAIVANISRVEKKKKYMVVCRTHGIGSAYHARSDGIPVSVPTIAPQGLAILLVDAAIQIEVSKGEASLRLLRAKSLPPMYNLDWP
ncbi:hypothetical protein Tco_0854006 [Tanacetum coccineum]